MPTASHHVPRPQAHPRRARVDRSLLGRVGPAWLTMLAICGPLLAASVEVRLKLPVRARIDLENRDTILPAPFIVVSQEGSGNLRGTDIDVQKEFERYLHKVLRRETDLRVIEPTPVDYPTYDLDMLSREKDFWAVLGERSKADLILVGSLDFDIQDRSGYKTEEYVSPFNGQTYYRQVLVEQTGFEYDIVVQVYDGRDGELLYTDNFKDFKAFETEKADPLRGMFENLYALEDRVVNIFAQKEVEASRILLGN
jgi:hypothetical protein